MVDKLQTTTLSGVEILATGTWNDRKYTTEDLDNIVEAFDEGNAGIVPPVKLGHQKNQNLLDKEGLPAAGYVTKVMRKGTSS